MYSTIRHYTSLDCGLPLPSLLAGTVAGSIHNEERKYIRRCTAEQYNQTIQLTETGGEDISLLCETPVTRILN